MIFFYFSLFRFLNFIYLFKMKLIMQISLGVQHSCAVPFGYFLVLVLRGVYFTAEMMSHRETFLPVLISVQNN